MPRPQKTGLDYFPVDVDIFTDLKIRILTARFGPDGFTFYLYLLARIYRNGYFIRADEDFLLIAAADLNMSLEKVGQMLHFLLGRALFDDTLFKADKVLTSAGIQRRFQEAVKTRAAKRAVAVQGRLWLLDADETAPFIRVEAAEGFSGKNTGNSGEDSPKKSKENPSREEETGARQTADRLIADYGRAAYERYIAKAGRYRRTGDAAIFTAAEWMAEDARAGKLRRAREISIDTEAYEKMVAGYIPAYGPGPDGTESPGKESQEA